MSHFQVVIGLFRRFKLTVQMMLTALALAVTLSSAHAQTAEPRPQPSELRVGVNALPPYVMRDRDGSWYGLGIDLLNSVTRRLGTTYRPVEIRPEEMVAAVESGQIDMALGAVPINADDEAVIDFTLPYYSGDLGIALRIVDKLGPKIMFQLLSSPAFLYMLGLLTGPVFVIGALIWLLERRANPEQFEPRPARGVFSGFWWATVTMTTVGYGDKAPVTFLGRLLAMFWMFAALILAAITTAQLAAGLTSSLNSNFVDNIGDLSGLDVGTVSESAAAAELDLLNITSTTFNSVDEGLDALDRHDIDAFVYDRAILQWAMKGYSALYLTNLQFFQQNYGLIVPQGDPSREAINIAILKTLGTEQWHLTVERYLPSDAN